MANRQHRANIAQETIHILEQGYYETGGVRVDIRKELDQARDLTVLHHPEETDALVCGSYARISSSAMVSTEIDVCNETSLSAARRHADVGKYKNVMVLNFASAKNPGGGFIGGSEAQEESLARASGLYWCLLPVKEYYEFHREKCTSSLYSDHIIVSPGVPVFRDDNDQLLIKPYKITVISSPAVNAGAVTANEPINIPKIIPTMTTRIDKILTTAFLSDCDILILGAWGCGVFRNEPSVVAKGFASSLLAGGRFNGLFKKVVFAVLDRSPDMKTISAFKMAFGR